MTEKNLNHEALKDMLALFELEAAAAASGITGECNTCGREAELIRCEDGEQCCVDCIVDAVEAEEPRNDSDTCECGNRKPERADFCRACVVADEQEARI